MNSIYASKKDHEWLEAARGRDAYRPALTWTHVIDFGFGKYLCATDGFRLHMLSAFSGNAEEGRYIYHPIDLEYYPIASPPDEAVARLEKSVRELVLRCVSDIDTPEQMYQKYVRCDGDAFEHKLNIRYNQMFRSTWVIDGSSCTFLGFHATVPKNKAGLFMTMNYHFTKSFCASDHFWIDVNKKEGNQLNGYVMMFNGEGKMQIVLPMMAPML